MKNSPKWSTNEVEERYSDKDLRLVEHFLSIEDAHSAMEGNSYFDLPTGRRNPRTGKETHYIIKDPVSSIGNFEYNASIVLANLSQPTPFRPCIPEDELFLELLSQQEKNYEAIMKDRARGLKHISIGWLALLGTTFGGAYWSEVWYGIGGTLGIVFSIGYTWQWISAHFELKKRQKRKKAISSAMLLHHNHDNPI